MGKARSYTHLSLWTHEDRERDPEGFYEMMQGDYDISCPECNGQRVLLSEACETYTERRHRQIEDTRLFALESGDYELYRDASL